MDKLGRGLMRIDGPEGPGNSNGSGKIAFRGRESIGGCRALKEEESQEDEDFGPYPSGLMKGVDTKGLECGKDDKNGGPSVI